MNFKEFNNRIYSQFNKMQQTGKLFRSNISGQQVWETYLSSFKAEDNKVFRDPESSEHNCNCCHNFIRRYGNIVAIDNNGNLMSIFSDLGDCGEYGQSAVACNNLLVTSNIQDVFFETFYELDQKLNYGSVKKSDKTFRLGIASNLKKYTEEEVKKFGVVNSHDVYEFCHFNVDLNEQFVDKSGKSVEQIMGAYRDKYSVFKRAMEEISIDTLELVKDLIKQGSLLDGTSHLNAIEQIIPLKKYYNNPLYENKSTWCWEYTYALDERIAKFKNTLIGVLCTELTEGVELNKACENWNKRVDPVNYMKAVAPITKKQIEEAKKFVEENGYESSFNRRFAVIEDIKSSEILHLNAGDGKIKEVSIFDNVKSSGTGRHKRSEFDKVEEISIEKFMTDVIPSCSSVEAYIENRMVGNLVTLTTSVDKNAKQITKWNNIATNYSWTFNGNLAGKSQLTQMVESKGGRTDGVLRCTHSWNEIEPNQSLMDAHVFLPTHDTHKDGVHDFYGNDNRVGWNHRTHYSTQGTQDVDYTAQAPVGYVPVENITFPDIKKMPEGVYTYKIHNWSFRNSGGRGKAEIAFEGNIFQYEYPATKHKQWITVAEITLKNGRFSIKHFLPETTSSKEMWGIESNQFHKVNLLCKSPNHWGDNNVGNLYYFFMIDKCKCDVPVRSFHNENLLPELAQHRKVLEVLGATNMLEPAEKQLSGVGFNSTVRDELIVRCKGTFNRMLKIKF